MKNNLAEHRSLSEVHESVEISDGRKGFRKILAFFGPAYLISVGYMDPGNWATDLAGGSKFGYTLIWVLLMSNIMALLLQSLSARLGIVRRRDLAQANRETYPKVVNFFLYLLAEVAIAATDLAEVLGMAIGIHLLTGLPLIWGVSITILDTFLLLFLQQLGMRKMEVFIIGLVAIVGFSFLAQIILARPDPAEVATGLIPGLPNDQALYIAIGIIGATVMPHNLYLHSALVQTRKIKRTDTGIRNALKWNFIDSAIALNIAFLVNAAILILAATVFFKTGRTEVAEIMEAHRLLAPLLGNNLAPILFAVALIAAGQSSTITGTLAGQIVMEGYLSLRINPWIRRLITRLLAITPAFIVIYYFGDEMVDELLVFSQVILSMQLGFAIIPLIHFVSDRKTMGKFTINLKTQIAAWLIAAILVYLNIRLLYSEASQYFSESGHDGAQIAILTGSAVFAILLVYIIFYPLFSARKKTSNIEMHKDIAMDLKLEKPVFNNIAVALEFSDHDANLISAAIGQGNPDSTYILIHVVESASARLLEKDSADFETIRDQERLDACIVKLKEQGFKTRGLLGYKYRAREISRILKEENADLLVIGAHGHRTFKDWIYGETINSVRHKVDIPLFIVKL